MRSIYFLGTACLLASLPVTAAQAQSALAALQANVQPPLNVTGRGDFRMQGQVILPASSVARSGDVGRIAHTHLKILVPVVNPAVAAATSAAPAVTGGPPYNGYFYETPASLACIYGLAPATTGCNPNSLTAANDAPATNGSKAVAVVDAYDLSSAATDLQTYSTQFGLPAVTSTNFQVAYATGTKPGSAAGTGWDLEEALDIEMAHAMAPNAKIYLVEAASSSFTDLDAAVAKATQLVQTAGGGEVSMSYGGTEFSGETSAAYEQYYSGTGGVVYFASTGDAPGTQYPSTSTNVVAVGGTSTSRRNDNRIAGQQGFFRTETAWSETGGGLSAYFKTPTYQSGIASSRLQTGYRGVPDISFDANPYTGVWVECSTGCGYSGTTWTVVGGTSVASPSVAALTNSAGSFFPSSAAQLNYIYNKIGSSSFFDVSYGVCGTYAGYGGTAGSGTGDPAGWDFCTGVGSPRGLAGLGGGTTASVASRR